MSGFNSEFFTDNRKRLADSLHSHLVILSANGHLQRSADTTFPFRQDSNFWYLTGINEPDYILVINSTGTFLIEPKRGEHRDLWDGAVNKDSLRDRSGITDILEFHEGWNRLDKLIKTYKKVHTIAPFESYMDHFGFYANPARGALLQAIQKHRKIEVVDIRKQLARMRQIKQPVEIEALRSAITITAQTLQDIRPRLGSYSFEYELAADITAGFMRRGSLGHAYQPIIAAGKQAATIHYIENNKQIMKDELILLDVGAEVENYSADITRTYAINEPSKRQVEVYGAVQRVQQFALGLLKSGQDMKEFEQQVDAAMAKELVALGLLDDEHDKRKLKKYYPHLASHFLGLDTHDAADYTLPLEPGMVLTVEPGIYIPEEHIGIRIEDDVLITDAGNEVLSSGLSSELYMP